MFPEQHRTFVRRDMYSWLLNAAELDLVLTLATQMLILKSDDSASGEVKDTAKVLKEESAARLASTEASWWEVQSSYEMCRHLPLNIWSMM